MNKLSQIIIILVSLLLFSFPVYSAGYSVLVLPDSCLDSRIKHSVSNVDIEELLARKFIDRLEFVGSENAPTMGVIKISIKNNSNYITQPESCLDNAKILSSSYGVPRVLMISSKVEKCADKDKFNIFADLPILYPQNSNVQVVTKLTMYDSKYDKVIWSDVYYKRMDISSVSNINSINAYYDELIQKVLVSLKETKETHAVVVSPKQARLFDMEEIKEFFETKYNDFIQERKNKKQEKQEKQNISTEPKEQKLKPQKPEEERLSFKLKTRYKNLITSCKNFRITKSKQVKEKDNRSDSIVKVIEK